MKTEQRTFYIYHVPGVKIGCTCRLRTRLRVQGLLDTEWEILETHTDSKVASAREQELQREYGYKVDIGRSAYNIEARLEGCSKGGKKSGKKSGAIARDSGQLTRVGKANSIRRRQPVLAYRRDTGEFVGEFESQTDAARQLGVVQGGITSVLNGKSSHAKGYHFELKHNNP